MSKSCEARTEVYSRVCGFYRPVQEWNPGKKAEFKDRKSYIPELPALKKDEEKEKVA